MALDDLFSTETAFIATATAAVFSPRTRETLRKGAVYGVAGALKVGDVVTGAARGVARGVSGQEQAPGTSRSSSSSSPARRSGGGSRTRRSGSSKSKSSSSKSS